MKNCCFWEGHLNDKHVQFLFESIPEAVTIVSDAGKSACGAFVEGKIDKVCHKNVSLEEQSESSTWRELVCIKCSCPC